MQELDPHRRSLASNLTMSISWIGGGGFFFFMFIVGIFAKYGLAMNQLIPIAFFYFAALFGICYLVLRQAGIMAGAEKNHQGNRPEEQIAANYLRPVSTAQLNEPRDVGIGSVTEHTTRTLDHVPVRED
ncbi:hypothetical protein [Leptolyngbya sp. 7M]|uniref:hypothetical protein n=1 Tax=Leptolyngbya sp. 7M TaxID=2812896 RepID=UPI001B8D0A24|nr:hypothetical protein [Leptolyngbya sp. 7M]QYO65616.1 hypothetical protein JVX88_02165 [Leptolyngbya sp. 7M]